MEVLSKVVKQELDYTIKSVTTPALTKMKKDMLSGT